MELDSKGSFGHLKSQVVTALQVGMYRAQLFGYKSSVQSLEGRLLGWQGSLACRTRGIILIIPAIRSQLPAAEAHPTALPPGNI